MILFKEIYDRAVNLFDDPDIQKAYVFDKIKFQKKMFSHFENGIAKFTNPRAIAFALVSQQAPEGSIDIFMGDGGTEYYLTTIPKSDSEFCFKISGVVDRDAKYIQEENKVIFSKNIPADTECSVEWYFSGAFNTDFRSVAVSGVSAETIAFYVKDILAHALVLAWAEKEKNFILDIRNLLTDTDFKIYSPANSIRAKTDWVKSLRFEFDNLQTKLGWTMFGQVRSGGQLYGP